MPNFVPVPAHAHELLYKYWYLTCRVRNTTTTCDEHKVVASSSGRSATSGRKSKTRRQTGNASTTVQPLKHTLMATNWQSVLFQTVTVKVS